MIFIEILGAIAIFLFIVVVLAALMGVIEVIFLD